MARKPTESDPRIGNDRVGLLITRGQIEHLGHAALKAQMMIDNSRNIVGFGSCQLSGVYDNPLTADQKRRAQVGAWGDVFKMIFLQDIGATDKSTDWGDYVFDRIAKNQLPEPTDLYAGSTHEARWYEHHFTSLRRDPDYTRGMFKVWEHKDTGKRIHILDRNSYVPISSSEVRTMIERRDPTWRNFVPAKLWEFYEYEYPPHLRSALVLDELPADVDDHPVGTKAVLNNDQETIYTLRDDGKWRVRNGEDEGRKSLGD